jgi:hypothetical protein
MPEPADWCGFALIFIVSGSLPIQRPGLENPKNRINAHDILRRFFAP